MAEVSDEELRLLRKLWRTYYLENGGGSEDPDNPGHVLFTLEDDRRLTEIAEEIEDYYVEHGGYPQAT